MSSSLEKKLPIPQRPPFLFVDEVLELTTTSIITKKRLTGDEFFFKGHFPELPIMPGVLLCESLLQSGALMINMNSNNISLDGQKQIGVVTKIDDFKFKKLVRPGDELIISVQLLDQLDQSFKMKGSINVNQEKVCQGHFSCALVDYRNLT